MRRLSFFIGVVLSLSPTVALGANIFDAIFEDAQQVDITGYPDGEMMEYVREEMRKWNETGIELTEDDIKSAVDGDITKLCTGKSTPAGEPLLFDFGAALTVAGSCDGLRTSIVALIDNEQEADQLGQDLQAIANGSELAIANEGDRPVNIAHIALLLRRVWAGTSTGITPWDTSADPALSDLKTALASEPNLEKTVLRFQHGVLRDQREADQTFQNTGTAVGSKLSALAGALGITGIDQTVEGEYAVPSLGVKGVGLWVRKDDVGLYWVQPKSFDFPSIQPAGTYPSTPPNGDTLARPYSAVGANVNVSLFTPLCSRTVARHGYLCRPLPPEDPLCEEPDDPAKITLVQCGGTQSSTHDFGPNICSGMTNLFLDDGTPLIDPARPGHLNPALTPVDTAGICTPQTKAIYQDDISSHACFVGHCIEQSLNGHSLVPNRNTVLIQEATSPFLAYWKEDPKLGLYTEAGGNAPYPMPPYIGHQLIRDSEARFCLLNNKAPYPLMSLCAYRAEQQNEHLATQQMYQANAVVSDTMKVGISQENFLQLSTIIGYRASLDQSMEITRKVFYGLSGFVQQISDLLIELKRAPLTDLACPWTGPLPPSVQP